MRRKLIFSVIGIITLVACNAAATAIPSTPGATEISTNTAFQPITDTVMPPASTETTSVTQTNVSTETTLSSETASPPAANTALPTMESFKATVTADLLSCRYG